MKLTEPQKRHLRELVELEIEHGVAAWYPRGSGEKGCARRLYRAGLVGIDYPTGGPMVITLTAYGRDVALGLR